MARWCHVTTNAVKKWIRERNLPAFRTPGGHYRIRTADFEEFLTRYRMPMAAEMRERRIPKVLVVDDDPAILDVGVAALSEPSLGLAVASASNGYEALITIGHLKPDVVVLDLRMPRIDGLEVCRKLKENPATSDISIIVLTGFATKQNVRRAEELGVEAVLSKPVPIDSLVETVRNVVAARPAPSRRAPRP